MCGRLEQGKRVVEMAELKPCPFCGGKAKYIYSMPYNAVKCTKCNAWGKTISDSYEQQDGRAKAIKAWNRRVNDVECKTSL